MNRHVYLAGPDVFLPDATGRAACLKAICARHGLIGVSPLDPPGETPLGWEGLPAGQRIALANEAHIRACDLLIANLTPFRGPSGDVGTVYEIGYARALGRRLFGWTNAAADFFTRTRAFVGPAARCAADGSWRDGAGMLLESFGMHDNLMIEAAIVASGGALFIEDVPEAALWTDLTAFERCVAAAAGFCLTA